MAWFDWFHANPEFSLNSEWRVKSCFGTCCAMLLIVLCGLVVGYYLSGYDLNRNARVGYTQYMEA